MIRKVLLALLCTFWFLAQARAEDVPIMLRQFVGHSLGEAKKYDGVIESVNGKGDPWSVIVMNVTDSTGASRTIEFNWMIPHNAYRQARMRMDTLQPGMKLSILAIHIDNKDYNYHQNMWAVRLNLADGRTYEWKKALNAMNK